MISQYTSISSIMITTGTIITTVKTPSMVTRYIIVEVEVECSMYSTSIVLQKYERAMSKIN